MNFQCADLSIIIVVKITTKLKHTLKPVGGYGGCSVVVVAATHVFLILITDGLVQERRNSSKLTMELRFSCTNPSKWQPQARPAMVGGHSGCFFCFRNSERLMTCYLPWYYFCSIALVLWSLAWVHKLYFHPANIKFTNIFHYCRACFSFSGLHASGQIWPY